MNPIVFLSGRPTGRMFSNGFLFAFGSYGSGGEVPPVTGGITGLLGRFGRMGRRRGAHRGG